MSVRHHARTIVLQTLFEIDSESAWDASSDDVLVQNAANGSLNKNGFPFAKRLLDTVVAKRTDLNDIIEKAAPEWPLDRIAVIDRNVLRIGLSELLFADPEDVPPKVAINEAIELAKEFGSESSGRFVNGVLGAVYRELGEPNKEAPRAPKVEELPTEDVVGALVYGRDGDTFYLALVHDVFGHWTLMKGRKENGEETDAAVQRKVKEEIGLDAAVEDPIGENEYVAIDPDGSRKKRRAQYFLAQAPFLDLRFKKEGGLDDAQWFRVTDIGNLNFYDDMLPIITNAVNTLAQKR
jgi:N utilization substance protein B